MAAVGIIKCSKIQSISNKFSHIQNSHFNSVKMLLRKYALFTENSYSNCSVLRWNVGKKEMNKERVNECTNQTTDEPTGKNNNRDFNSSLEL